MRSIGELIVLILLLLVILISGCSLFGGTDTNVKPVSKLETELEVVKKDIDKSHKELENVQGDVTMVENRLSKVENNITNINQQVTKNIQHNESLKSLAWTVAGIYMFLKALELLRAFLIAKSDSGNTVWNLIRGKSHG